MVEREPLLISSGILKAKEIGDKNDIPENNQHKNCQYKKRQSSTAAVIPTDAARIEY
ncbi:hypothetical protein [Psychrobacter aquimaris]|uniref:hypothetical protein n=1 Tax=Psychrobacter aquimaris TaxID=292733 RepID=UPI003FD475D2